MKRRTFIGSAATLSVGLATPSRADTFPARTITWVVPFPPGGPNDFFARMFATRFARIFGQSVVVENRAGGGGMVGTASMLKSAPDGYTMGVTTLGSMAISPHVSRSVPYTVPRDFSMVSALARVPQGLFANVSLPANNLPELVELAKRKPGQLSIAAAGIAGMSHLAGEMLRLQTRTEITVVPYRGAAPALVDLLAGHVQLFFADLTGMLSYVQSGKLKVLAVAGGAPSPALPNVDTSAQGGFPRLLAENSYCLVGPAGLPATVVARYSEAVRTVSDMPDVRDTLAEQGAMAAWTTPADFEKRVMRESARWQEVAHAAGIRVD